MRLRRTKKREGAERGSERGSRAQRKSRRALPRQTSLGPRGHREALWWRGEGGRPRQPRRPKRPSTAWGGLRPLPRWIAFLIKDSSQLLGFFYGFHSCVDTRVQERFAPSAPSAQDLRRSCFSCVQIQAFRVLFGIFFLLCFAFIFILFYFIAGIWKLSTSLSFGSCRESPCSVALGF